jgi:RNA polymerase sigma factor (sigma-70 family)
VWAAVKDLPVRQRACVILRYLHDLPEGAIAEIMDCSTGTVRSQLTRARRKLKDTLGPALDLRDRR